MNNYDVAKQELNEDQQDGLSKFRDWWQEGTPKFGVVTGCAGSGKSYSVLRFIRAMGIDFEKVVACAPTHTAAQRLGEQLGVPALSLHAAYNLRPQIAKWEQSDQDRLDKLNSALLPADASEKELLDQEQALLAMRSKAHATQKLMFVPDDSSDRLTNCVLLVIDECSMISFEMWDWIVAYTPFYCRVLLLGDQAQIFPVGDSTASPSFSAYKIANLTASVRSAQGSVLHGVIKSIREAGTFKTQCSLLSILNDPDNPLDEADGSAFVVSGRRKRQVIEHLAKTLPSDGLAWRVLAYRNATVDLWNKASKMSTKTPVLGEGDPMIARSAILRFGLAPSVIGTNTWRSLSLISSSTGLVLGGKIGDVLSIPLCIFGSVAPARLQSFLCTPDAYSPEIAVLMRNSTASDIGGLPMKLAKPSAPLPTLATFKDHFNTYDPKHKLFGKKTWAEDSMYPHLIHLFDPADLSRVQAAIAYWSALSLSFGKAMKHPEQSETVREFMEGTLSKVLGVDFSKPKAIATWFMARTRHGDSNLVVLKKAVVGISMNLKNLADDVVYPFASTLHKSQGATIGVTVLDLTDISTLRHGSNDEHIRLLYTAVSRAAKKLIVFS